ncbi:LysR family transcriptional regulator [Saccharopolyspora cebuensis]|uniref:LysR family transcriptional regulator n=1 Tax=Saccharopolyspora cebuensis TaxID=418759 RepID=A0ABV4CMT4_9PSEU
MLPDAEDDAARLAQHLAPTLAALRAVAAEQHLTRAAQVLGVPQPTLSRALARLAEHVGAPVIAKRGRGIRLTRTGELLAEAAAAALGPLEVGCRAVVAEVDPERGRVVLGFQHTMGGTLVPELLRGFGRSHPHVRFELVQGSRDEVLARMRSGAVDLGLVSPPPGPPWRHAVLRTEPLVALLPTGHPLAGRAEVELAALADEGFVVMRSGYGMRGIFDDLAARAGFAVRVVFEAEEIHTVRGLVAAGLGVAVLPPDDRGPVPGTAEVPLRPAAHRDIALAWPDVAPTAPAVRAFREHALGRRSVSG